MTAAAAATGAGAELAAFVQRDRARILARWRRELRAAALHPPDFDSALVRLVDELARVLPLGDDAPLAFAELVAGRGAERYRHGARLRDTEREVSLLGRALVCCWAERNGPLSADIAVLLDGIVAEAVLRVARDYARAAEANEARLRLATLVPSLSWLSEVVLVLDRRGAIAMAVGPVREILGVAPEQLVGAPGRPAGLQALHTGREQPLARVRIRNAERGEERSCEVRAFPLREGETVVGAVELVRDVTRELRHEEELRRADRELTALHARLLRRAHAQAMAELASATASALNNELNAIAMSLQLVAAETGPKSEAAARHLHAIDEAVQRSAQLLQRMQQLAARRPNAPPRAVPLNDVLMEALDLVRPELTAAGGRSAMRIDARLGDTQPVLAQPTELRELLCTLLLEARDELPRGGVLQLVTRPERDGAALLLTHALGDEAAPAGDPSLPSERATMLAAARDRARRWGGELEVETRAGRMTVRLLLPTAPAAARPSPSGGRPALRAARRVLVVDDDAGNRETLTELLTLSGHEVRASADGRQALAEMEIGAVDAALVDLAMPDMDGIELARRLRAMAPSVRIALVTGWEPGAFPSEAAPGVIDAVFRKPIDFPAILRFLDDDRPAEQSRDDRHV